MYLDFLVKVPTVKGKITRRKKSNVVYIEYEYDRVYDPSRKYTFPKRVTIGKLSDTDPELMKPNQNFLKYFPDAELPESKNRTSRSSCLRVGTYFVLRKIIEECSLNDILGKYFGSRDMGLFFRSGCLFDHSRKQCSAVLSGLYIQPSTFYGKDETIQRFNRIRFPEFSNR